MAAPVHLQDSRARIHTDPIRNFKFVVQFQANRNGKAFYTDDTTSDAHPTIGLGFMSVSGLNMATEPIPYREGGDNTTPRKLPGQTNFSDITLSRGVVIGSHRNWQWVQRLFHAIQGRGKAAAGHDDAYFRFDVDIHVLHHPVNHSNPQGLAAGANPPKLSFRVYNAWPSSLAYSDLDAGGNAVLIEQMTLTHEGWEMAWARTAGNAATPAFGR